MLDTHEPLTPAERLESEKPLDTTDLTILQSLVSNSLKKLTGGSFKYRRVLSLKLGGMLQRKITQTSKWQELATRFQKLGEITGREKRSGYVMNVIFDPDDGITVQAALTGPFSTEAEALTATEKKIIEAEEIIKKELAERGGGYCDHCTDAFYKDMEAQMDNPNPFERKDFQPNFQADSPGPRGSPASQPTAPTSPEQRPQQPPLRSR
jgi:hypothetical protein